MYKQCFELLTAQGPKPHKSFSVAQGSSAGGDVTKELDQELKGNVFCLSGQRIQLPPNPSHQQHNTTGGDFHNTGGAGVKKAGVAASLNIVHQFLVFQLFVPEGVPFSIDLHVRDKHNTKRRLSFTDSVSSVTVTQASARIPNALVARDRWINLCLDVNSFIRECFTTRSSVAPGPYGTPQVQPTSQLPSINTQKGQVGGGSGDIAQLHNGKVGDIANSKIAAVLAKTAEKNSQNSMKVVEVIQLEGTFKIRKIFTSRSQIPADLVDPTFGNTAMNGISMRAEDIIQAAMSGQRIEQVPKNFDFGPQVEKLNQVLSFETVTGGKSQHIKGLLAVENENKTTGLAVSSCEKIPKPTSNQKIRNVQIGVDLAMSPNAPHHNNQFLQQPYQNSQAANQGAGPAGSNGNSYLQPQIRNAMRSRGPLRGSGADRKSSVGNDSSQGASSPFPKGGIVGSMISLNNSQQNAAQRELDAGDEETSDTTKDIQNTANSLNVMLRNEQNSSGLRNSGISIRQGPSQGGHHHRMSAGKYMKINMGGMSNATGDSVFQQANSTASNHGQRSNQTQSTAYSVRTTSSGNHKAQNSSLGGGAGTTTFSSKRSNHANSGRPVYDEQVEEMVEESGSQHLLEKQVEEMSKNESLPPTSPRNNAAYSAKVRRKGLPKASIDTNLPKTTEKVQQLLKQQDPLATPKLHQLQEVHQTTILEENETMRGSIDRKLGLNQLASTQQKQKRIAQQTGMSAAAAARKTPVAGTVFGKNARNKSSAGGNGMLIEQQQQSTSNTPQLAPQQILKGKGAQQMIKGSISSANLEDNIEGVIGSKLQNRHQMSQNKAISPLVGRKQVIPKNQLQLSSQKKQRGGEVQPPPQFQIGNSHNKGPSTTTAAANNGKRSTGFHKQGSQNAQQAQFIYNGSIYGSNHNGAAGSGHIDSDGEQSDFKTTTLRFTNNNFINNTSDHHQRNSQRDSSVGAHNNRENKSHYNQNAPSQHYPGGSLLNTLTSQGNAVQNMNNARNSKQFGTSDNFKKGNGQVPGTGGQDQRTDGFAVHQSKGRQFNNSHHAPQQQPQPFNKSNKLNAQQNNTKSPMYNRQFSTLHGAIHSDMQTNHGGDNYFDDGEEEELIEEDINVHGESPLINAHTKQATGQKARALFQGIQPPLFRSTESDNFHLNTAMTGFTTKGNNMNQAPFNYYNKEQMKTPLQDKSSILASKPFIGGKPRHQLIRSPDKSFNSGYNQVFAPNAELNSAGGGLTSELRQDVNQRELQREIEEEIGRGNPYLQQRGDQPVDQSERSDERQKQMEDTCTSDFYQVPVQGGIPVQLTIDHGRRPFTPPFAQLIKVQRPPTGGGPANSSAVKQAGKPDWTTPMTQVMSQEQRNELKNEILLVQDGMMEEPIIEEEIEGTSHPSPSPAIASNKQRSMEQHEAPKPFSTASQPQTTNETRDATSALIAKQQRTHSASRNKQDQAMTFAEDQIIEFSESFKNRELKNQLASSNVQNQHSELLDVPSGSNTHTFGRRSRAAHDQDEEDKEDDLDRKSSAASLQQQLAKQRKQIKPSEQRIEAESTDKHQPANAVNEPAHGNEFDYRTDVIDPEIQAEQKKRLLYDKSLKAYYDPETGQYFEMKAQLIVQGSLPQL